MWAQGFGIHRWRNQVLGRAKHLHIDLSLSVKSGLRKISIGEQGEMRDTRTWWHFNSVCVGRWDFSCSLPSPLVLFFHETFREILRISIQKQLTLCWGSNVPVCVCVGGGMEGRTTQYSGHLESEITLWISGYFSLTKTNPSPGYNTLCMYNVISTCDSPCQSCYEILFWNHNVWEHIL